MGSVWLVAPCADLGCFGILLDGGYFAWRGFGFLMALVWVLEAVHGWMRPFAPVASALRASLTTTPFGALAKLATADRWSATLVARTGGELASPKGAVVRLARRSGRPHQALDLAYLLFGPSLFWGLRVFDLVLRAFGEAIMVYLDCAGSYSAVGSVCCFRREPRLCMYRWCLRRCEFALRGDFLSLREDQA